MGRRSKEISASAKDGGSGEEGEDEGKNQRRRRSSISQTDDSSSSGYVSYVEGGCYIPYCWSGVTVLYLVIVIILATTVALPSQHEQQEGDDNDVINNLQLNNIVWFSTDIFLAVVSAVFALHVFLRSSTTVSYAAFWMMTGWSVGFILRSVMHRISVDDDDAVNDILKTAITALASISFSFALFWFLILLDKSWKVVVQQTRNKTIPNNPQQQQRGRRQQQQHVGNRTPLLSWINAARISASVVYLGTTVVVAASVWVLVVRTSNDTSSSNSSDIAIHLLLQFGQGLFVTGYLLTFTAAAIIWGIQAQCQVVYLPDFFLPPFVAASMILWCAMITAIYRIVLLVATMTSTTTSTYSVHLQVVAPIVLQCLALTILTACHNLILSFFPQQEWDDYDKDAAEAAASAAAMTLPTNAQSGKRTLRKLNNDQNEQEDDDDEETAQWKQEYGDDVECIGYHYELDQNSIQEEGQPSSRLRDASFQSTGAAAISLGNKRVLSRKGQTQNVASTIQIVYGDDEGNDDAVLDRDGDDESSSKVYESGRPHVYGKYDDWVFGEDVDQNIAMVNPDPNIPPRRFFEHMEPEEKEDNYIETPVNDSSSPSSSPLDLIRSLSMLPITTPDRDDDQSIATKEDKSGPSSAHPSAINCRSSSSRSLGMAGQVKEHDQQYQQQNNGTLAAAMADFLCVLKPQLPKRITPRGRMGRMAHALDLDLEEEEEEDEADQIPKKGQHIHEARQTLERATTMDLDPCHAGGNLEEIHRSIQAASSSAAESILPPLLSPIHAVGQLSTAWADWMAGKYDSRDAAKPKPLSLPSKEETHEILVKETAASTPKCEKPTKEQNKAQQQQQHKQQQQPDLDTPFTDNSSSNAPNNHDFDLAVPVRTIVVDPNDQGSLCFQEDEIGSAIHDAILAQQHQYYLEYAYVNGRQQQQQQPHYPPPTLWNGAAAVPVTGPVSLPRGRSSIKSRRSNGGGILSLKSLTRHGGRHGGRTTTCTPSQEAAERDRKKNLKLARSLSRERSKAKKAISSSVGTTFLKQGPRSRSFLLRKQKDSWDIDNDDYEEDPIAFDEERQVVEEYDYKEASAKDNVAPREPIDTNNGNVLVHHF